MTNEKRLIYGDAMAVLFRNAAKRIVSDSNGNQYEMGWAHGLIEAADRLKTAPTVDAVSRGVHDQVRWERDVAIEQLESYGISLGEKADAVKVVRCKDCKHLVLTAEGEHNPCDCVCDFWMTDGLNDNDFCYYGERKDNERKAD